MKAVKMNSEKGPTHILLPITETCSCLNVIDCKTFGFFLKISKEIGKAWRKREGSG